MGAVKVVRAPDRQAIRCAMPALRALAHGRWAQLSRREQGLGWWGWARLNLAAAVGIHHGLVRVDGTRVQISQRGLAVLRAHDEGGEA